MKRSTLKRYHPSLLALAACLGLLLGPIDLHAGEAHKHGAHGKGHEKARGEGHHKARGEGHDSVYGEAPTLEEPTPISRLLAYPERYVGKTVRIEGRVLDVCPMKGCWMDLGSDDERIQVRVEDDVIVFPADAKGRIASAQGVVEAVEMDREGYVRYLEHLAEERGETFDPAAHDIGDGPYRIYQIRGTGAEIR